MKAKLKKIMFFAMLVITSFVVKSTVIAAAITDDDVINILRKNKSLFKTNTLYESPIRAIGWGVIWILTYISSSVAKLYDKCFEFIDFTNYGKINEYINSWKPVIVALVCASLFFMGVLLIVNYEKKPKILINICLLVLVLSSGTYLINKMNTFISDDVRKGVLGNNEQSAGVVYSTVGAGIHDLLWLDDKVGLSNLNNSTNGEKNALLTYDEFTKEDFNLICINDVVKPSQVKSESKQIVKKRLDCLVVNGETKFALIKNSSGVAWTNLLNEYYYRYNVDWISIILELFSFLIIYLFMSYKVIRTIWDIAVQRLLAALYSTNLNNNQKLLKILDSIKDSYIILILTMILIKFYLLACKFISAWGVNGIIKGFVLLFIAFAVIDGPNIIQKLTGMDAGASEGAGKVLSLFYGTQMVNGVLNGTSNMVKRGAGLFNKFSGIESLKKQQEKASFENNQNQQNNNPLNGNKDSSNNKDVDLKGTGANGKNMQSDNANSKNVQSGNANSKNVQSGNANSKNVQSDNANGKNDDIKKDNNKGNATKDNEKLNKLNGFNPNSNSNDKLKDLNNSNSFGKKNGKSVSEDNIKTPGISKDSILNKTYSKKNIDDNSTTNKEDPDSVSKRNEKGKFERKLNSQNLNQNVINKNKKGDKK